MCLQWELGLGQLLPWPSGWGRPVLYQEIWSQCREHLAHGGRRHSPEFLRVTARGGEAEAQALRHQRGERGVLPSLLSTALSQEEGLTSWPVFQAQPVTPTRPGQWGAQVSRYYCQETLNKTIPLRNITSSICQNLAYNLSQLKSRDSETYERLVDSILLGPDLISETELETRLGIDCYHYHKSRKKRESLRESKSTLGWEFEADKMETNYGGVFLVFLNLISLSFNRQNYSHHVQGESSSQERFQTERCTEV